MIIEGVIYHRYMISYTRRDGRRRRVVRWSPGRPWIFEEVDREFGADVKPHSNLYIRRRDPG